MKPPEATVLQAVLLGLTLCIIALDAVIVGLPHTPHNYHWPAPIIVNIMLIFFIFSRASGRRVM